MRHSTNRRPITAAAVVPAAVAGSIALLLSAPPATAAEPEHETRVARAPQLAIAGVAVSRVAPATAAAPATYTVQRGDTVFGIAMRYGLRTADVLALNGLTSASIIQPGQVLRLTGSAAAAPAAPATPVAASGTYTVVAGDTLSAIAKRNGVTVQALFAANGLGWSSIIYPGQKLVLPGGASAVPPAAPAAPAAPATPVAASGTYTVVAGDTLSAIAKRNGITVQTLFAANGLGWSSIIYPGQKLALAVAPVAPSPSPAPAPTTPAQEPVPTLDAEQIGHVRLIIGIGRELGVPQRGIAIALGAAMQESWLRNLSWGDRDSRGLFQQRPSAGWGTEAEVQDAARATRVFYGGPSDPNGWNTRGLLDIPGWQDMSFTQAAQAVQISAYPDRYARWETAANTWLATYG
ncbi:LysM peptidoglycan-binding domain-containing protein [Microbacterium sp. SS28]|uniref:muramidase family protein n=1 Tax=Microbacterium sp. SS28 TaxID=2919948 RepID=UPI001FA9CA35|nr:LysM peptidoglycan-binding domain-containing protein [Microbacterium sp. SS28]